ncbi:hypothetical protein AB0M45_12790 [Nocardia sp. NPDC051787]|uniref:hypothetical protein n=1 Tax=Nocardia sp. NPDC051787 TaxID=3155415 RepID=UPI0034147CEA
MLSTRTPRAERATGYRGDAAERRPPEGTSARAQLSHAVQATSYHGNATRTPAGNPATAGRSRVVRATGYRVDTAGARTPEGGSARGSLFRSRKGAP